MQPGQHARIARLKRRVVQHEKLGLFHTRSLRRAPSAIHLASLAKTVFVWPRRKVGGGLRRHPMLHRVEPGAQLRLRIRVPLQILSNLGQPLSRLRLHLRVPHRAIPKIPVRVMLQLRRRLNQIRLSCPGVLTHPAAKVHRRQLSSPVLCHVAHGRASPGTKKGGKMALGGRLRRAKTVMYIAYLDEAGNHDSKYFVLAGYLATAEQWHSLSKAWRELVGLNSPHYLRISEFHMTQMHGSKRSLEHASWFYRLIEKHVTATVSCVIDTEELQEAFASYQWPPYVYDVAPLRNPYTTAFKQITTGLMHFRRQLGLIGNIDFIFDETNQSRRCLEGWQYMVEQSGPQARTEIGKAPVFAASHCTPPLQAADMISYWVHAWYRSRKSVACLPFPWQAEREIPWLEMSFSRGDFVKDWNNCVLIHQLMLAGVVDPGAILRAPQSYAVASDYKINPPTNKLRNRANM
jgi:hypothetical protein